VLVEQAAAAQDLARELELPELQTLAVAVAVARGPVLVAQAVPALLFCPCPQHFIAAPQLDRQP